MMQIPQWWYNEAIGKCDVKSLMQISLSQNKSDLSLGCMTSKCMTEKVGRSIYVLTHLLGFMERTTLLLLAT